MTIFSSMPSTALRRLVRCIAYRIMPAAATEHQTAFQLVQPKEEALDKS